MEDGSRPMSVGETRALEVQVDVQLEGFDKLERIMRELDCAVSRVNALVEELSNVELGFTYLGNHVRSSEQGSLRDRSSDTGTESRG